MIRHSAKRGRVGPFVSTSVALELLANPVNTNAAKVAGYEVFNTTTGIPVWSVGNTAAALWVDATGGTAHTPI